MLTDYLPLIDELVNKYSPASRVTIQLLAETGSLQLFKKNESIFSEKKYNAFEYFQLEGISHRYNTDEDLQVVTTGIYQGAMVLTPHFARTLESRSIFSMQALTDCTYVKFPIGAFHTLRAENKELYAFGQKVVENEFIKNLNYEVLFRSRSAKDRLMYFRSHFPQLENLIPHTVIASFLGITPVSFSRLRNELAKN